MSNTLSYWVVSCLIATSACSSTASRTVEQIDDRGEGGASGSVARSSGGSASGGGNNDIGGQAHSAGSGGSSASNGGSAGNDTQGNAGASGFANSSQGGSAQGGMSSNQAGAGSNQAGATSNQAGTSPGGATGTEAVCNDSVDNDKDGKLNCSDSDCAGKLCQKQSAQKVYPTRDYARSQGPVGTSDTDGETNISISVGKGAHTFGVIKFDNIAADSSLTINRAVLRVYFNDANVRIEVRDAAGSYQLDPDPPSAAGYRDYDVTTLVKKWANGSQIDRFLTLHYDNTVEGGISYRATEFAGTDSDPHLVLDYEARCSSDKCPVP